MTVNYAGSIYVDSNYTEGIIYIDRRYVDINFP